MKVAIGAAADIGETVAQCKHLGVDQVVVFLPALPDYRERGYPDASRLRAFKGRLEDCGIQLTSASYWFGKWPERSWKRRGCTNPDVVLQPDRRCLDAMLRTIEILGACGINSVLHYVDIAKPTDADQVEACWEGLVAMYRELIPLAATHGVGLGNHSLHRLLADGVREGALEAGVRQEDYNSYAAEGWGGPFLVGTWRELQRLVRAVPSPANGVTLCTGMDIPGGDVPALVREFADKIHFCQLRDHTAGWPAGREVLPGRGRVDLRGILRALSQVGYRGLMQPEHLGKPSEPQEDLLARAVDYYQSLLSEIKTEESV